MQPLGHEANLCFSKLRYKQQQPEKVLCTHTTHVLSWAHTHLSLHTLCLSRLCVKCGVGRTGSEI